MSKPHLRVFFRAAPLLSGIILSLSIAPAAVVVVGPAAFPAGSLITFDGLATGTEVNGLTLGGLQFSYSLGNGNVVIDGGPGTTNNITPPNVVSIANNTGVLTILLPSPASLFGYGYAVLNTVPLTNATTIALFSGVTAVGTLSYNGVPDPLFTGGFAGIQSTIPFNRVALTFNSASAPAFALDNIRTSAAVVPEPSTMLLVLGAGLFIVRRRNACPPAFFRPEIQPGLHPMRPAL